MVLEDRPAETLSLVQEDNRKESLKCGPGGNIILVLESGPGRS